MRHFRPHPKGIKPYIPPAIPKEEMEAKINGGQYEVSVIVLERPHGVQVPIEERFDGVAGIEKALELVNEWTKEKKEIRLCSDTDKWCLIEELKNNECYTMRWWENPFIVLKPISSK